MRGTCFLEDGDIGYFSHGTLRNFIHIASAMQKEVADDLLLAEL